MRKMDTLPYEAFSISRRLLGLTQSHIAEILGIQRSAIAQFELGMASISDVHLATLVSLLHIDKAYLLKQEGVLFNKETGLIISSRPFWVPSFTKIYTYCAFKDVVCLTTSKAQPFLSFIAVAAVDENGTRYLFHKKGKYLPMPLLLQQNALFYRFEVANPLLFSKLQSSMISYADLDSIFQVSPQDASENNTQRYMTPSERSSILQTFASLPDINDTDTCLIYSRKIGFLLGIMYALGFITMEDIVEAEKKGLSLQLVQRGIAAMDKKSSS